MNIKALFLPAVTCAVFSATPAYAFTPFALTQTFNNPDPQRSDGFGRAVSISDTNALIGSRGDNTGASNAGSAYLFDTVTGNLLQTFNNPDPQIDDLFGEFVSISGTNALIGVPRDDTGAVNAGSAYLFDTVTGNLLQTFNNPDPDDDDQFGASLSISGTSALIGAYFDDTGAFSAGSAYLFDTATGNLLQTFNNPNPQGGHQFGRSVSISGTNALIGTPGAGSAYLFDLGTGNLLQTFNNLNPNPVINDLFGFSVSLSGTNALIGAIGYDTDASNGGIAYLFDTVTGNLLHTFNNPNPATSDEFGRSVSLSGTNALIGSRQDDIGASNAGSAYLFDTVTGNLLQTINNPTPEGSDQFGFSVSIDGGNALIGALFDNTGATSAGSAYLYQQEPQDPQKVPESSNVLGLFLVAGVTIFTGIKFKKKEDPQTEENT